MPDTLVQHPTNGTNFFGRIEEKSVRGFLIPGAPIVLKKGKHSNQGGFGVRHIWARHQADLVLRGYKGEDDVAKYVASIVCGGSSVYCEFEQMRGVRVAVIRSAIGKAVLEHTDRGGFYHYSVVTAFAQKTAQGTRVGSVVAHTLPTIELEEQNKTPTKSE